MHDIATKHGVSVSNVATRYVLDRPQVGAAIVGARNGAHVRENLRALRLALDDEDTERLRKLTEGRGPSGPVFGLEREPGGEHAAIMRYNLNRAATDERCRG